MTPLEVGTHLVKLINEGKFEELYAQLYSPEIASIEPTPGSMQISKGMAAINAKNEWWYAEHETKGLVVEGPWPHGNQFILTFDMDLVHRTSGKPFRMKEAALYTVEGGKIVEEKFFYES